MLDLCACYAGCHSVGKVDMHGDLARLTASKWCTGHVTQMHSAIAVEYATAHLQHRPQLRICTNAAACWNRCICSNLLELAHEQLVELRPGTFERLSSIGVRALCKEHRSSSSRR
jgi:hypothetical protein